MNIKTIIIQGVKGDIEINATAGGASVIQHVGDGIRDLCEVGRNEPREARFAKGLEVARAVYGTDRKGNAAATNSMVHDVMNEIDRIAGC